MGHAWAFGALASSALVLGAVIGVSVRIPSQLLAVLLAFAAGSLATAMAFELFGESYEEGGAVRAGLGFLVGAVVFVGISSCWTAGSARPRGRRGPRTAGRKQRGDHLLPAGLRRGAVIASLAATLMPEACEKGGPSVPSPPQPASCSASCRRRCRACGGRENRGLRRCVARRVGACLHRLVRRIARTHPDPASSNVCSTSARVGAGGPP